MKVRTVDQYFNPKKYIVERNPKQEKMMDEAIVMADLLTNKGNVKRVGVADIRGRIFIIG